MLQSNHQQRGINLNLSIKRKQQKGKLQVEEKKNSLPSNSVQTKTQLHVNDTYSIQLHVNDTVLQSLYNINIGFHFRLSSQKLKH